MLNNASTTLHSKSLGGFSNGENGVVIHTMPKNLDNVSVDEKEQDKEKKKNKELENKIFNLDKNQNINQEKNNIKKNRLFYFIIFGIILTVLTIGILVYFLILQRKTDPSLTPIKPPVSPIDDIDDTKIEPEEPIEPKPELIPKVYNIYNDQGDIEESIVLSLAKEQQIDFNQISLTEYKTEDETLKKYLEQILSHAYYLDLKNQKIFLPSVLTITYSYSILLEKELIDEDLKIGFLKIKSLSPGITKWEIYSDVQIDENLNSVSVALSKTESGIFALVKKDINEFIPKVPEPIKIGPQDYMPVSLDSDSDGLTDIEEAIFSTDPNLVDSDKDGFTDYKEILNLYSPIKTGKAVLIYDDTLVLYQNPQFKYYLLYPKEWKVNSIDLTNREIIFSSTANLEKGTTAGEFIVASIADNPGKLSLKDWYLLTSSYAKEEDIKDYSLSGFRAISTINELTIYLTLPNNNSLIYILNYDAGIQTELNYKTVFLLLQKTFTFNSDSLNPQLGQDNNPIILDPDDPLQIKMKQIFPIETISKCVRDSSSFTEIDGFQEEIGDFKEYDIRYNCYTLDESISLKIIENISPLQANAFTVNTYGSSLLYLKNNTAYLDLKQTKGFWLSGINLIYFESKGSTQESIKDLINLYQQAKYPNQDFPAKIKERDVLSVPLARDEKRIIDMNFLKEKLEDFKLKSEAKKYPETLAILGEDIPIDLSLTGDEKSYQYNITEYGANFQIKFILEIGFNEYQAGEHILTKQGIQ